MAAPGMRLLEGVRVLDLTNVLAGPFCCYQFAQAGADVVKVEVPGSGDLARQLGADPALNRRLMGASFLAQNAGKRSITVNLKHPQGRAAFLRLAAKADVVVENFRPGVMDRLGVGYDTLRAVRPELVYCAISGFGQTGPLRDNPAYDQIVQGLSGVMGITGDAASAPLRVGFPICDTIGGLTAAFAVAAALNRVARGGGGAFLDVSMLEATVAAMGWPVSNHLIAGVEPQPMGNENATAAPSGAFRTADGLLNIAANQQVQFETLCDVIGRPELRTDPRFADREARKRNRYVLRDEIEAALAADSAGAWEVRLNRAGVPAGRILSVPQVLAEPVVEERRMLRRFDAVEGLDRGVTVVRAGFAVDGEGAAPDIPPPALGQDTDAILAEAGFTADETAALRAAGAV
ncbi:MAG TPA: CaiB/BaiF CoA-transferase family protein [Azospirillaceae bacterium]|nr:CaiB/BaiF CoA-transferase family protein [Azospirillaceae bacterium]